MLGALVTGLWCGVALVDDGTVPGVLLHGLRPWWGALSLPALAAAALARSAGRSLWAGALVVAWLWPLRPVARASGPVALRLSTANLLLNDDHPELGIGRIQEAQPDIAVFVECGPGARAALRAWRDGWPHAADNDRLDEFGTCVRSRFPLRAAGAATLHRLPLWVDLPDGPIRLDAVHLAPPYRSAWIGAWRQGLRDLAAEEGPRLVVGDLNATPWHPSFQPLRAAGLSPALQPLQHTWPDWAFLPPLMALDHVLTTPDLSVVDAHVLPGGGSDHRAVFVSLRRSPPAPPAW